MPPLAESTAEAPEQTPVEGSAAIEAVRPEPIVTVVAALLVHPARLVAVTV